MTAQAFEDHPLRSGRPPEWASLYADSELGPVAGFEVGGVECRLRWIPAGSFQMGAGDNEPKEWEFIGRERPRHRVTLSEGFWMAETPCTQALWQAVTGENPSRFVDPERPVEQVSWNDVQGFLRRLNERCPGLEARLPTEAQWEYACRAGTETATYAGELKLVGEYNAPVLDRIAWYGGNSGHRFDLDNGYDSGGWGEKQYDHTRAGTRKVATRLPNAWGLHDMLGNVWEWCDDLLGDYGSGPVRDPMGPATGPKRVLRGGSWYDDARSVRAASRLASAPSDASDLIGFRLSRGQR